MATLWNPDCKPREGIAMAGETIAAMFWNAVRERGPGVWLREKKLGLWRAWTWNQVGEAVGEVAGGLMALGFAPGDTASILSNTILEWVLADLAVLSCAGVASGIYPTDAASQVHYLTQDSHSSILFVEDDEQLDKALEVRAQLPLLKKIIVFDMDGLHELDDEGVISLAQLRALGRQWNAEHPQMLPERVAAITPGQLAILVYTSGTTGKPKGAMHTHAALVQTARGLNSVISRSEQDEAMAFLPLCHIAERMGGEYLSLYTGCKLNFVENPDTVPENVREIAPTVFVAVPRVWEKFYSGVTIAIRESSRLQQRAYAWAIGVGRTIADLVLAGQNVPASLRWRFQLARWLALDNVRKMIGIHRARYLVTGAAPISPELIKWYLSLGVPMLEVWGMTETCGVSTAMLPTRIKPGSIGPAAHYNQVRLDPQTGEIQVKGPNVFAGYLNLPDKTAETFTEDGWLATGDVGTVDADGYYRITDRMKDIIITAGGKNITPSEIENELKFSPYVTDAVVIGDKRPYLTVIVMIDQENVEKYAQDHDVPFSNYASLTRAAEVQALVQGVIDEVNTRFARVEQIKKFFLLDTQLTAEDEELTPTMKLKRKLVEKKYAGQIEAMYRGAGKP
ncbi:AMP-dependent synthetase/ligase [Comamonas flocculans]|uniref:Long-chain fatty acid--CoA ligase n=1 Tax=Comamonas flocculans TaxID=2597701 RepID=A0A5B8RUW0_9BURK|nr:long-chain fatty acid--CoA ligase [Comamonas flocculans]QEA13311.1 long-chain fatty acid--CoA ligase [Comamonas flocculans]